MSVCPIPAGGQSQEPRSVRARLTGNIWLPLSYHSVKIKARVFLHRSPFFSPALPLMFPSLRDEIACCTNPFAGKGGKVSGIIRLATGPCFLNARQNITVHRHKISGGDLKMLTFSVTFWRVTPSYFLAGYHYISTAPWLCLCPLITNSVCHSRRSLTSSLATFFKVMSPLLCLNKLNRILKAV